METPANIVIPDHSDRSSAASRQGMRWNLVWYIPVFAFVIWYFALANAKAAYENVGLLFRHWTWLLLLSPATYFFFEFIDGERGLFTRLSHEFVWAALLNAVCAAVVLLALRVRSNALPVHFMLFIPRFFSADADKPTYDRRYLFSVLVLLALILGVFLTLLANRQSFPLCWPANGVERIRLVPLLPCPE